VAGHVPGALNRPFNLNVDADGKFKPAAELRAEFDALLAGRDPATVVHMCGSGVSAVPNLIAMEVAGLGRTALYAGSWSEWCSDPGGPWRRAEPDKVRSDWRRVQRPCARPLTHSHQQDACQQPGNLRGGLPR